jgi:hypothetical protein
MSLQWPSLISLGLYTTTELISLYKQGNMYIRLNVPPCGGSVHQKEGGSLPPLPTPKTKTNHLPEKGMSLSSPIMTSPMSLQWPS